MAESTINIKDGEAFYAHETSINFTPSLFNIDFKSLSPRVDPRNKEAPTWVMVHNLIMVDPYHAKQFHAILGEALKKFQDEFGKIDKSKALQKAEKKQKQYQKNVVETKADIPHYMG